MTEKPQLNPLLKLYVVFLAFASVYELARALRLPTPIAWLAVIGQIAWMYSPWSAGSYTLVEITQDKVLLARVIAPVIFLLLVDLAHSIDRKAWHGFIEARDYEGLELFIVKNLLGKG